MKGYTIDCKYIIRVSDLMQDVYLPRPTKKNVIVNYGEVLPIISIEV